MGNLQPRHFVLLTWAWVLMLTLDLSLPGRIRSKRKSSPRISFQMYNLLTLRLILKTDRKLWRCDLAMCLYLQFKWSRKGFLRTRWKFGDVILDLVNIHLFHDSCNLIASSAFPSPFALNRFRTLNYTLDKWVPTLLFPTVLTLVKQIDTSRANWSIFWADLTTMISTNVLCSSLVISTSVWTPKES